ncbi:hypothetical protein BGZ76_010639 [Entomortierella beljakovae]|nr:hypothetical protein BGZ76_010639 [Entomortierella beljakovae]
MFPWVYLVFALCSLVALLAVIWIKHEYDSIGNKNPEGQSEEPATSSRVRDIGVQSQHPGELLVVSVESQQSQQNEELPLYERRSTRIDIEPNPQYTEVSETSLPPEYGVLPPEYTPQTDNSNTQATVRTVV